MLAMWIKSRASAAEPARLPQRGARPQPSRNGLHTGSTAQWTAAWWNVRVCVPLR